MTRQRIDSLKKTLVHSFTAYTNDVQKATCERASERATTWLMTAATEKAKNIFAPCSLVAPDDQASITGSFAAYSVRLDV